MQNIFPLLLFTIFLIFFIPFIFQPITENFIDKNSEKIFVLKNDKFKYKNKFITIKSDYEHAPKNSKINFKYSIPLKFHKVSDRQFTLKSKNNNYTVDVNFSDKPIFIDVNKDYEIHIQKSHKSPNTYNIIQYDKPVGSIRDNKIKSISLEINNNPDTIAAIFTALKFKEFLQNHKHIDYDKFFSK